MKIKAALVKKMCALPLALAMLTVLSYTAAAAEDAFDAQPAQAYMTFHDGGAPLTEPDIPDTDSGYTAVILANHAIELAASTHTIPGATHEYEHEPYLTITVASTGALPTGALLVTLSGPDAQCFTLSEPLIDSIPAAGTDSLTLNLNPGLALGTYTCTVTVGNGNAEQEINASCTISAGEAA